MTNVSDQRRLLIQMYNMDVSLVSSFSPTQVEGVLAFLLGRDLQELAEREPRQPMQRFRQEWVEGVDGFPILIEEEEPILIDSDTESTVPPNSPWVPSDVES
mgnify:CR=1 FL=1